MSFHVAGICRVLTVACLLAMAPLLSSTQAAETRGPGLVPQQATGFIHFHVGDLLKSPAFESSARVIDRVRHELNDLTSKRFGVRFTDIAEVTGIMDQSLQQGPSIWAFTFSRAISEDGLSRALGDSWRAVMTDGQNVFVHRTTGRAIYVHAEHTLFVGSAKKLSWLISQRAATASPLEPALRLAKGRGQITVGFTQASLPRNYKAQIPAPFRAIAEAQSAAISIRLGRKLETDIQLTFENRESARQGQAVLRELVQAGRTQLDNLGADLEKAIQIQGGSFDQALLQVLGLGLIRTAEEMLSDIELDQSGDQVVGRLQLKETGTAQLVLIGLTAIQAVGTKAEASFDSISRELDGPTAPATIRSRPATRFTPRK